ncbi:DNA cytosine methyltransferase [Mesorhizobium sp. B2-8-9]|uniref:DNA cytosine methyltransferase n=1 Tax=Mesorhizobium sp. B2-8-9 TaxID=2589899 RepID=UPI00112E3D16|nr:DNA cytosine methyltransferase [Mesorhizobium sp. B2-8-9]TPI86435.1 DNA cytosine methyltransferase [Mesorhizobium sp. B2-8-9]
MSKAYYNEIDKYAATWLRNLITAGLIAPGDVDERDIRDVRPSDLRGYTQVHAFAGIGVWSYGLRRGGWPDDRPVWTGSCPCQPFSAAGRGDGFVDERHLWPHWHHLIAECRPDEVFGEQVASKDGLAWLDLVFADMEGTGYAIGALDTCSAGSGAPHIRQRLRFAAYHQRLAAGRLGDCLGRGWRERRHAMEPGHSGHADGAGLLGWLDDDHDEGLEGFGRGYHASTRQRQGSVRPIAETGEFDGLAHGTESRRQSRGRTVYENSGEPSQPGRLRDVDWLGDTECIGAGRHARTGVAAERGHRSGSFGNDAGSSGAIGRPGPTNGHWRDADWLFCRDGKWRPVEPNTFPLAHGATSRVGRLRAYGNAVDAEATRIFIEAYLDRETLELEPVRETATGGPELNASFDDLLG